MNESDYISRTKNRTKKNHILKKLVSNLLCKFCHFSRKLNFWALKNAPFGRPWRPNATWNFTPIFIFSSLRISYVRTATSQRGGGGVCISLVVTGRANAFLYYWEILNQFFFFMNFSFVWKFSFDVSCIFILMNIFISIFSYIFIFVKQSISDFKYFRFCNYFHLAFHEFSLQ